jgi:hypothetical protein
MVRGFDPRSGALSLLSGIGLQTIVIGDSFQR